MTNLPTGSFCQLPGGSEPNWQEPNARGLMAWFYNPALLLLRFYPLLSLLYCLLFVRDPKSSWECSSDGVCVCKNNLFRVCPNNWIFHVQTQILSEVTPSNRS